MDITQATISRDIKELRLIKVLSDRGRYKYAPYSKYDIPISHKLLTIFTESYVSSDYANNLVIVKTLPGMAQAAASTIDSLNWLEIVGCIAGDDTIMIVCRAEKIAEELVDKFGKMAK
jgi:transcriptional regulator of arginine metabolism